MTAALRYRNFRIWTGASFVSIIGTWMQVLGLNWYILHATGSAGQMGTAVLLQALPVLVLGSWGGVIADRLPARPMLIATQLGHATLAAALCVISMSHTVHLPAVYAIALLGGAVSAFENPVMGRFSATVVDPASLGNALSLGSVVSSAGRILGMGLGGVLVAVTGPAALFAGNAVSFLAVIMALLAIRSRDLHPLPQAAATGGGIRAGFKYLVTQPVVLTTLALAMVLGGLGRNYQITMAAMTAGPLDSGASGYAMLSTVFAVGTVVGGLLAARSPRLGYRTLIGAGVVTSVLQIAAGFAPGLGTFAAVVMPIAVGAVLIDTTVATRVQQDTLGEMRGRVLAALAITGSIAGAAGAPLLGWLSEATGPRAALITAGTLTSLSCVIAGVALARLRQTPIHRRELGLVLRAAIGRSPVPATA